MQRFVTGLGLLVVMTACGGGASGARASRARAGSAQAPARAPMPDVIGARQRTPGGIEYVDVRAGTGADALPRQCYFIHYTGWLSNGRQFETTHDPLPDGRPARPIAFAQGTDQVIAGWDRGFGGMRVGGVRRLYVPARLAYGDRGRAPAVPPNAALVFDIALLAVSDTMPAPRPRGAVAPQCPPWETVDPGPA